MSPVAARLTTRFLERVDPSVRERLADWDRLTDVLVGHFEAGQAAWPTVTDLSPEALGAHLAGCLGSADDPRQALERLRGAELVLACACALGDDAAIAAFEANVLTAVDAPLARLRLDGAAVDEIKQRLRQQLFVADAERGRGIAKFAGHGSLQGWLRVTATRLALREKRRTARRGEVDEDIVAAMASPRADPELQHLKRVYVQQFKTAAEAATGQLTSRERNLLRLHAIEGMSVDDIGAVYHVHRTTAARWIAHARDRLAGLTRRVLIDELAIPPAEHDSIMRMIRSDLELSLPRVLQSAPEAKD